jgi:hypothetical protein
VTIVTDTFRPLAIAQARSRGYADLALIVVSHPVGGLRPAELAGRAVEAVTALASTQRPAE